MDQEPEHFEPTTISCGDYQNTLSNVRALTNILNSEPNSEEFTTFAYCMARDIKKLRNTQSTINFVSKSWQYEGFLKELKCFLNDIGYTHQSLTTDTISIHLQSRRGRLSLIEVLICDLLAARIEHMPCLKNNYVAQQGFATDLSPFIVDLKNVLLALKLKETPPNITRKMFYLMIEYELISLGHGKLLRMNSLSCKKYRSQDKGFNYIHAQYKNLRQVLVSRLNAMGQGGPPNPKNDRVISGLSYFEESVLLSQRYEITQYLAHLATLLELRTNFDMNEKKQKAEATLAQRTQKSQPKVFITPQIEHKPYGEEKKNQSVNQNKSIYDMDAPGCSGTQNEGGAGLDEKFSHLNVGEVNNTRRNTNRDNGGLTAGHQSNEPFFNDPSTSQGNDSAPLIDPPHHHHGAGSIGRGRGGSRRGRLWSRYINYVGRENYGYCYEERRFMEISEPTFGNRVFRGGVGGRGRGVPGRGMPYNALQHNSLMYQQLPPNIYLSTSQMLLFQWNYTFMFATYDVVFSYY